MTPARAFVAGLAIICAGALVACSGSTKNTATSAGSSAPLPAPSQSVEQPVGQIPWNQVGPGWVPATQDPATSLDPAQGPSPGNPTEESVMLYLLDPAGKRYLITTFALSQASSPADSGHTPKLVDWSGDGRQALFENEFAAGGYATSENAKPTETILDQSVSVKLSLP